MRAPSAFSMIVAVLPSITATQELVVPRSDPDCLNHERLPCRLQFRECFLARWYRNRVRRARRRPERRSGGVLDLDLLGLAACGLRDLDRQHALRHRRLDAGGVDPRRQLQRSIEDAVNPFGKLLVLCFVLVIRLDFDLLLSADRQDISSIEMSTSLRSSSREFGGDDDLLVAFRDVHAGHHLGESRARHTQIARDIVEETIDLAMERPEDAHIGRGEAGMVAESERAISEP